MEGVLEKKRRGALAKGYVKRFYCLRNFNLIEFKERRDSFDEKAGKRIGMLHSACTDNDRECEWIARMDHLAQKFRCVADYMRLNW